MWSREQDQITASRRRRHQHHHNNHHQQQQQRGGISSSSSKSHSSISSPFSSSTLQPTSRRGRTMEGVWKDIALATPTTDLLHHNQNNHQCHYTHHHTTHITTTHQTSMSGVILQDFLAGPFKETTTSLSAPPQGQDPGHDMAPLGSASLRLPPPATILSLNSGLDFHYLDTPAPDTTTNSQPHHQVTNDNHHHPLPFTSTTPFADAIGSPAPGLFFYSKKRSPEQKQLDGSGEGGDRRHKRMIKNRESAARSRARKQAYSNELEMEVSQLEEENARLKRQHEELRLAMAAQLPTKKTLLRTSTF